eukprot:TRINITY_DN5411_c0_g2_i2.p1 TRINITY_DN5411_c0_g2~~TRINITY_DN5411_c0_g2_i2.p1  ORF type:complete len:188 (-),score=44.36 TRINITY_DN5411_c0_g2_i2:12-575(-)
MFLNGIPAQYQNVIGQRPIPVAIPPKSLVTKGEPQYTPASAPIQTKVRRKIEISEDMRTDERFLKERPMDVQEKQEWEEFYAEEQQESVKQERFSRGRSDLSSNVTVERDTTPEQKKDQNIQLSKNSKELPGYSNLKEKRERIVKRGGESKKIGAEQIKNENEEIDEEIEGKIKLNKDVDLAKLLFE